MVIELVSTAHTAISTNQPTKYLLTTPHTMEHYVNHKQLFEIVKNYIQDSNVTKPLLVLGHYACGKTDVISHCLEVYGKDLKIQELSLSESLAVDSSCDLLYVETHELAQMPDKVEIYCDNLLTDFSFKYKYGIMYNKYDLPNQLIIEITSPYEGVYGSFVKLFSEDIDWYYVRDNFEDYMTWRKATGIIKPMDIDVFSSQFSGRNEKEKQLIEQGRSELDKITALLEAGDVNKALKCTIDASTHVIMSTLDDTVISEHCRKLIEILRPYQHLSDRVLSIIKRLEDISRESQTNAFNN